MEIFVATAEHLNQVYKLICELQNKTLDKNSFKQIYQANISNGDIHYLVAFENTNKYHNIGIGTALFIKIKEIAASNNCLQLEVCCNKVREQSHQFYIKQGMSKSHYKFTYNL